MFRPASKLWVVRCERLVGERDVLRLRTQGVLGLPELVEGVAHLRLHGQARGDELRLGRAALRDDAAHPAARGEAVEDRPGSRHADRVAGEIVARGEQVRLAVNVVRGERADLRARLRLFDDELVAEHVERELARLDLGAVGQRAPHAFLLAQAERPDFQRPPHAERRVGGPFGIRRRRAPD